MSDAARSGASDSGAKRRKFLSISGVSVHALSKVISECKRQDDGTMKTKLGRSEASFRKELKNVTYEIGTTEELQLVKGSKKSSTWALADPAKLVSWTVDRAPHFGEFLLRLWDANGRGAFSIILYLDEITPGNIVRPDNDRIRVR